MHIILALLLSVFLRGSAALTASPVASPPECDAIHALVGGELVEWVGYPQGWNLPADLTLVKRIDFEQGGIVKYHSHTDGANFITVFLSYDETTDANGEHLGAHSFCGPFRITDQ